MNGYLNDLVINVDGIAVRVKTNGHNSPLKIFSDTYISSELAPVLTVYDEPQGLFCEWHKSADESLKYYIDVERIGNGLRSFPAPKQGAFNQALGKKTKTIIDATAGWGSDALLMCSQGYRVTLLERNPVMALLLEDAMHRLVKTPWVQDNCVDVPKVIHQNAIDYFADNCEKPSLAVDCIYLDPMFPPKRKKSAASNKYMQLLQHLIGHDLDASDLAEAAMGFDCSRVVVKRPDHAAPLLAPTSLQFSSKLVHYDVYLSS